RHRHDRLHFDCDSTGRAGHDQYSRRGLRKVPAAGLDAGAFATQKIAAGVHAAAILISNASLAIFLLMFTSRVARSSSITDNQEAAFWLLSSAAIFPRSLTRSLLTIVSAGRPR